MELMEKMLTHLFKRDEYAYYPILHCVFQSIQFIPTVQISHYQFKAQTGLILSIREGQLVSYRNKSIL